MSVIEQLRDAIERDDRNVSRIARDAGLSPIQVFRFINDERGLTTPAVDALCDALGLELRPKRKQKGR